MKVKIIPLEKDENILLITMHHIISDGWSIEIFIKELSILYQSYLKGEIPSLSPLEVQYADYANWQQEWLQQDLFHKQLNYWKNQLANSPLCLNLPLDKPRPSVQNYLGKKLCFTFSSQLTSQIKEFSQQEEMTLFMTLLTAFQILLYCYSGDEDICVGSPIANRQQKETQNMIGFFVNTLVLRTNCSGNPTLRELLQKVKRIALDAYSNQELPFEKIVEELNIKRNLAHNPLFQVWFALGEDPLPDLSLPQLSWKRIEIERELVHHDLTLRILEKSGQFLGEFEYKTSLFNSDTIALMSEHFNLVVNYLVNQSDVCLVEVKEVITTQKEQKKIEQEQDLFTNVRQKLKRRKRK